jgi:two-component system response regulator MprA
MRVLIVEDDTALAATLRRLMSLHGWDATLAPSAEDGIGELTGTRFDVAIVDRNLPGIDGIELCKRLRAGGDAMPILMLTARDGIEERVEGLDAGADDYLTKPFANEELVARLRALTRRSEPTTARAGEHEVLRFADVELDCGQMVATRGEVRVELTRVEFELLRTLMRRPRIVISREAIQRELWGDHVAPDSNALEVHVANLRKRLEADGGARLVQTVRGVGYVLREASA